MDILASHWHCILPVAVILIAVIIMQIKGSGNGKMNKDQEDQSGNENVYDC